MKSLGALALILSFLQCAMGSDKPICRDLRAPFEYSEASYCPKYGEFGCCGKRDERRAEKSVPCITQEREICADYTRNISCLTCSPLSGRMFDSENARIPLCRGYCVETYVKCRRSLLRMFKLHPWREGLVSKFPTTEEELERDATAFCDRYASESPYCYPEIAAFERKYASPPSRKPTDCVCAVPVATGLVQPRAIADPDDKTNRLFILEEAGIVKILDRNTNKILREPFLNMSTVLAVDRESEANLTEGIMRNDIYSAMNFILHPDFKCNGLLYVFYLQALNITDDDLGTYSVNVTEFKVNSTNHNKVDYDSERLIFSSLYQKLVPGFHLHGSALYFKDSYLHITIGRTPESEDVFNLGTYNGKIIRINVDEKYPGKEYAIPQDNPFIDDPNALPEIYAYGFVQPWRCSVDRGDPATRYGRGRVFCGDIGVADLMEEVNIIERGGNYGYPLFEGTVCIADNQTCEEAHSDVVFPINAYTYGRDIAVIGGYMYYGCLHPNLNGKYIFADYTGGMLIMEENRATGEWERRRLCIGDSSICPGADVPPLFVASLGQDHEQEIYIMAIAGDPVDPMASGVLYKLTDPTRRNNPQMCKQTPKFTSPSHAGQS